MSDNLQNSSDQSTPDTKKTNLLERLKSGLDEVIIISMTIGFFIFAGLLYLKIERDEKNLGGLKFSTDWLNLLDLRAEIAGTLLSGLVATYIAEKIFNRYKALQIQSEEERLRKYLFELDKKHSDNLKTSILELKNSMVTEDFLKSEAENTQKHLTQLESKFTHQLSLSINGLREIRVTEVFIKAKEEISKAKNIFIIGTAKQNYKDEPTNSIILEYLSETSKRVKENPNIKYKRITTLDLNETFEEHIFNLLDSKRGDQSIEILLLDDFAPAYTYLIVDESFFMLSLNYAEEPHNSYHYFTHDKRIINQFCNHFKSVWKIETEHNKIINKSYDFKNYLLNKKEIKAELNIINDTIKNSMYLDTLLQKQALEELKKTAELFRSIKENNIAIKHNTDNGNLISLFCTYLNQLRKDDSYETVTFCDFWENIFKNESLDPNFVVSNKSALSNGVKLSRLLVINKTKIHDDSNPESKKYKESIINILNINFEMFVEYPAYDFKILFTDHHDKLRVSYYNFAILSHKSEKNNFETVTEKILFEPSNNTFIDTTKIRFELLINGKNHLKNKELIESEKKMQVINKMWESQNISLDDGIFLLKVTPKILIKKDIMHKVIGKNPTESLIKIGKLRKQ